MVQPPTRNIDARSGADAALEVVWATAKIDAVYAAVLQTIIQPTLPTEAPNRAGAVALVDLLELCCVGSGGDRSSCEPVALAWKILYAALYLLDSIEDGDLRAGPCPQWSVGVATNLSTGLLATVGALLSTLEAYGVRAKIAAMIRADFFYSLLAMTAGQHHDLTASEPTLEQCWQIAQAKSGHVFGLACRSGALLAGGDERQGARLAEFGQILGLLIQVGDDLDDLWSRPGKPSDLLAGTRWTLPVAYAMTVLPTAERDHLRELLAAAPQDPTAEESARSRVLAAGAALYLATESRRLRSRAEKTLREAVPESSVREALLRLLDRYTPLKDR